jgi:hypothetical protein
MAIPDIPKKYWTGDQQAGYTSRQLMKQFFAPFDMETNVE